MRKKKDLPLAILKSLQPFVKLKGEKFIVVEPENNLLKVIDKDDESSFYFIIEKYQKQTNSSTFQFLMTRSPKDQNNNGIYQAWIEITNLLSQFDQWIKLLDEYESTDSFYDDLILNSYYNEFFAEFEIVDEDADINPFETKKTLLIDDYLEKLDNELENRITEENKTKILEIQSDIEILRGNLTTKSKKWVIDKVSKIFAKIAKNGTKFIKDFLTESKKEIIKQTIKGAIDFIKENGVDLMN